MATFTTMKGFTDIGDVGITQTIKTNLITYLDWGTLDKGAYFNVNYPTSGSYGGNQHTLNPVTNHPYYDDGQVWQGFRSNWVWESGTSKSPDPIQVSGVFIDDVFQAVNAGHHINYPDGHIVFDTAIATTSTVHAEYSHKWLSFYDSDDIPWFRETQNRSFRNDDRHFDLQGSGDWSTMAQTRVQLPAIAIEVIDGSYAPYQIGGGHRAYRDVLLHVITEDGRTCDNLTDYLSYQIEKTIFLFDVDQMGESGVFPLDYRGMKTSGALTYPSLVELNENGGYRYNKMRMFDTRIQKTNKINQNLYVKPVRIRTEVFLANV